MKSVYIAWNILIPRGAIRRLPQISKMQITDFSKRITVDFDVRDLGRLWFDNLRNSKRFLVVWNGQITHEQQTRVRLPCQHGTDSNATEYFRYTQPFHLIIFINTCRLLYLESRYIFRNIRSNFRTEKFVNFQYFESNFSIWFH